MCVHVNMTHRGEKSGNETTDDEPQLYMKTLYKRPLVWYFGDRSKKCTIEGTRRESNHRVL